MGRELWIGAEPAGWIAGFLNPFGEDVGSLVPCIFERFARVVHCPDEHSGQESFPGILPKDQARRLAAVLGGFTSSTSIWFGVWEGWGDLQVGPSSSLILSATAARKGRPRKRHYQEAGVVPAVDLPHRRYYLFRGQLDDITESFGRWSWISPNLWWPDDRAWFVATEIDLTSTYLGASASCVRAVLDDPAIEAASVECHDAIGAATD
jgi:hypothetical protein